MKSGQASISDIAKALGVSVSTVSRALKNHPDISEETCRKVQEYARRVHYSPNAMALALKQKRSLTIGVIIPEIIHHFFSSVISGIEDMAYGSGYRVMICQSNEDYLREMINVQALIDHRVDGLLVSISKNTLDHNHFRDVHQREIPIVFLDRVCYDIPSDRVITNDFEGARLVVTHLLERGCKKILHLAGPQHLSVGRDRYEGYRQALKENNIPFDEEYVLRCDTPVKLNSRRNQVLALAPKADAVFAVNDFTAVAAMRLLQENAFKIPEDIRVAGFGDDPIAAMVRPALTTVEQRGYDMGREAARMLINRLTDDKDKAFQTKTYPAFLKVRDST
ncbi:MAG: LacI family transcriptional regulator [Bacteroidia bacterium]|nr:MAG: LacI family transcriptional regulator [Bacteroidia bacterium]